MVDCGVEVEESDGLVVSGGGVTETVERWRGRMSRWPDCLEAWTGGELSGEMEGGLLSPDREGWWRSGGQPAAVSRSRRMGMGKGGRRRGVACLDAPEVLHGARAGRLVRPRSSSPPGWKWWWRG